MPPGTQTTLTPKAAACLAMDGIGDVLRIGMFPVELLPAVNGVYGAWSRACSWGKGMGSKEAAAAVVTTDSNNRYDNMMSEHPALTDRDPRLVDLHILVVDDDLGICRSMKEILEASGCRVETATDGAEGLRRIESGGIDLVISDVVMPHMDGYELFHAVQQRHPSLPVLMMTAFHYDRDHIIKRSKIEGLTGVIFKKPVDPARLREVMLETVEAKRSG